MTNLSVDELRVTVVCFLSIGLEKTCQVKYRTEGKLTGQSANGVPAPSLLALLRSLLTLRASCF